MTNQLTRRSMIAACGAAGALGLTAPSTARPLFIADNAAWQQALVNLQRISGEAAAVDKEWDRIHTNWEAARPSMDMIHWTEFRFEDRDHVARAIDVDERWQQFLAAEGKTWWAKDGDAVKARYRAALDTVSAYRKACADHDRNTGYDEISNRSDAYGEALADAEGVLMKMPAPHAEALLWKVEKLFGEEACGPDGSTPSWSGSYVAQFSADARRLLAQGRA